MGHELFQLATAPQKFPTGGFGSCACLAEVCGFVRVDSVLGKGAVTLGKCRHCSVQDWQPTRTGSAPTLLQKGLCGYVASPARVFSAPALGTVCGPLLPDQELAPRRE